MNKFTLKSVLCMLLLMVGASAWAEDYTLTISPSDFTTVSYADNNGSHTLRAVSDEDATKFLNIDITTNQVYQNTGIMQWQKNNAYIYNTTDLGTIKSVTVNSTAGSFTTYYGTTQNPTSDTTVGNGFFTIKVGSATGKTSSIVVVFDPSDAAAPKEEATISASNAESLNIGEDDEYTITYDGDGELSISSSDETVAEAIIDGNDVLVSAIGKGTATITITASETENYKSAIYTYSLVVSDPNSLDFTIKASDSDVNDKGKSGGGEGFEVSRDKVTLTFSDAYGTSHVKVYGLGQITIAAKEGYVVTNVTMTATNNDYAKTWKDQSGAFLTKSSNTITWDGFSPVITLTNTESSQARINTIEVKMEALTELDEVTVTSAGYATYVAPMNMIIGDGTVAKYITGVAENGTTLTLEGAAVVAENEAVLLVGEGTHKVYGSSNLTATKNASNKLVAADNAPVGSYVLQSQNGVVGFYQVEGEAKSTNGHAYLDLGSTSVKAFNLNTIATGIQNLNNISNNVTYDLMGRRVNNTQKGIFIINGKKVIK